MYILFFGEPMGRTREFDVDKALEQATILFWKQGYRSTSMEQLVTCTGVSRYGFYQEFGNKKELFQRCLQEYSLRKIGPGLKRLSTSDGSLADLAAFFNLYSQNIAEHGANGCLICNTATEVGESDPDMNSAVQQVYSALSAQFRDFIEKAQGQGEIRKEIDANSLSFCLLGVLQGVAVMAKGDFHRETLRHYLTTIFDMMAQK
ncbi:hypothetical protein CEX98_01375 [Pseudoalteromonas piscicida]|uniref:HTH tetR-type domain-containing protein n=2 Tax=Pseudoalteromonas piscicida TaxID=43662 RepID=A0A2A5JVL3_PSEO7|nr:hypothetical protein CEX98_01375 [Pseudoalteromonas piscicida]